MIESVDDLFPGLLDGTTLPDELSAFRSESTRWVDENGLGSLVDLPDKLEPEDAPGIFYGVWLGGDTLLAADFAEWQRRCLKAGLMCAEWPPEWGGQGWDALRSAVFRDVIEHFRLPMPTRGLGQQMVGPTVLVHGTEEQKSRFLPRIIDGTDVYAQAFSEPDAGSDLAGVRTRGEVVGDELRITGEKIWTSAGWTANRFFLLCRTDTDAPKHAGISYVLVDADEAGLSLRRTRQMNGSWEFAEERFDEVRAPLANVIGGLNNGWQVVRTTLSNERGAHTISQYYSHARQVRDLLRLAVQTGSTASPIMRQRLAECVGRVYIMRSVALETMQDLIQLRQGRWHPSLNKLFASEQTQLVSELATDMCGASAIAQLSNTGASRWSHAFLSSRSSTIMAGTSEIQKNIVGESIGLPRR